MRLSKSRCAISISISTRWLRARLCNGSSVVLILSAILSALLSPPALVSQSGKASKRPVQLDRGIQWRRDPATGELHAATSGEFEADASRRVPIDPLAMRVRTQMVAVTCTASLADGTPVRGLDRSDFRILDDGVGRPISYFDASTEPASIALVLDASPSVLRDSEEMKQAADVLINSLAPLDQAAVIDFSAHTYLLSGFSDVREQIRRAVARVDVRALLGDTGGSNIYEAVYLAASSLFPGRRGRKALLLLTDGQDSGLGLTLDPASTLPQPGRAADRLTFDDVARILAEQDIQVFAVSTENRPKVMTPEWLAAHQDTTLVNPSARPWSIPPYTLYLAELVRRAGGQLYFLRESQTMAEAFRKVAERIRAEYTLGFSPVGATESAAASFGWHRLSVAVVDQPNIRVSHRAAYYVPVTP
ncbi:MAG TPA: VWA domain-containing protein [Candidatus Acidoferrales bacterium]|nr:VWA domain-containing protein [Candidatus Acidoferrales bacterium]